MINKPPRPEGRGNQTKEDTMDYTITNTTILDHNAATGPEVGPQLGLISVLVEAEIDGKHYSVDYQTTLTADAGAVNVDLWPYPDEELDNLAEIFGGYTSKAFIDLLDQIKKEAEVQNIFREYVAENYLQEIGFW